MVSSASLPIPDGFISEMEALLGVQEAGALKASLEAEPVCSIRMNRLKTDSAAPIVGRFNGTEATPVEWCRSGVYLSPRPNFTADPLFHAGLYYVQEAASMAYEETVRDFLSQTSGQTGSPLCVLDLCAAPGGKSTAIINALPPAHFLVANEVERSRTGALRENLDRWGDPDVAVTSSPAAKFGELTGFFDIIAVDAPCSGEGMMRREPAARRQWSPKLVESCSALQRSILADVLPALKPGGLLIYSTCTFNRSEDEDVAEWIASAYGLIPFGAPRKFMPHCDRCEGLFLAAFIAPSGENPVARPFRKSDSKKKEKLKIDPSSIFIDFSDTDFTLIGSKVYAVPKFTMQCVNLLKSKGINVLQAGCEVGTLSQNRFAPSSRQVLSTLFRPSALPAVDLSLQDATAYLRGEALRLKPEVPKGFAAVSFAGHPLGLVKNIGARANNLYPSEWRIKSAAAVTPSDL